MSLKKKNYARILALLLTACLLLTQIAVPAKAAAKNTEKEEVVYVNLNHDGSVQETLVVNIFDLDSAGTITDYGDYTNIEVLNTTDEADYSGTTVTIETASDGKLYYEGTMAEDTEIPWLITIEYDMDGASYSADEIAGMSGELTLHIVIEENPNCDGSFYDDYALQMTVTLDTNHASNITADGATMANVGSDKQLSYTILAGNGGDFTITADVEEFEMDAISINGIKLSLDIEVDDEELMEQITDLVEAIETLDDGAAELTDGTSELTEAVEGDLSEGTAELTDGAKDLEDGASTLTDGTSEVADGAAELADGASELESGIAELSSGISQIQDALNTLNSQSSSLTSGSSQVLSALTQIQTALNGVSLSTEDLTELTSASSQISSGIDSLTSGIAALQANVSYSAYKAQMAQAGLDLDSLAVGNDTAIATLQQMLAALDPTTEDYAATYAMYTQLITLLTGSNANITGIQTYLDTVSESLNAVYAGALSLQSSYGEFDAAIGEVVSSLTYLAANMTTLADAVNALVASYVSLDDGIEDYTDAVAQIVAGYETLAAGTTTLVNGSSSLSSGADTLYSGTQELLEGVIELYEGTGTLRDGTGELDDGVAELLEGILELSDGMTELSDGTTELRDETSDMDTEISDQIDELIDSITGAGGDVTSFVSSKNTEVDAVQFVIQTRAIEVSEPEEEEEEEEENLNFFEKLFALFGM